MRVTNSDRYRETQIGSGVYKDLITGNYIKSPSYKSLRHAVSNIGQRVGDSSVKVIQKTGDDLRQNIINELVKSLEKPVKGSGSYLPSPVEFGKRSLKTAIKQNISNATDDNGVLRPGAEEVLRSPELQGTIKAEMTKAVKRTNRKTADKVVPPLSNLLQKSMSKRSGSSRSKTTRGAGGVLHGTGGVLHGTGIAYI